MELVRVGAQIKLNLGIPFARGKNVVGALIAMHKKHKNQSGQQLCRKQFLLVMIAPPLKELMQVMKLQTMQVHARTGVKPITWRARKVLRTFVC